MIGVFIGRFQPLHEGHIQALKQASELCSHLIILVGSADACRSIKNPWTFEERRSKLYTTLSELGIKNTAIYPLNDYPYNDPQWISDVRETVDAAKQYTEYGPVTLFGFWKEGNDYLKWFPDWKFHNLRSTIHLSATQIRNKMFLENSSSMPPSVMNDWRYYQKEAELFKKYPFPETLNFNCGDAVVECQGQIILVQRGKKDGPGFGAWALPGGFKNRNESFKDCAIRELIEETSIKVPEKVLRGSIVSEKLFDSPKRSFGINRNTLAIYIRILPDPDGKPPKIKASDDVANCKWVPLNKVLNNYSLYDDHKAIISSMTGVMPRPAYLNKY